MSVLGCLLAAVTVAGGCNVLPTLMYITGADRVPAAYEGLEEKTVAVVCRPPATLQYRNATASTELAKQVGILLKQNVKKIQIIEQRKVAEWTDENDWDDYTEIGRAVAADMVVGIDLEHFSLHEDQTLLQGKASVQINVYDVKNGEEAVFEKALPQILFPPNSPIAASDKPESEFRRQFIQVLAAQIAKHFFAHESHLDFANDSTALQ